MDGAVRERGANQPHVVTTIANNLGLEGSVSQHGETRTKMADILETTY